MTSRFATLTKCCGGALTIETLTEFQKAMREYRLFMGDMRELLAPPDGADLCASDAKAQMAHAKGKVDFPFA